MGSPYRHTTFGIKDESEWLDIIIAARKSNKSFIDFAWDVVSKEARAILIKTDSLAKYQGLHEEVQPPKDPFDLSLWKEYIKKIDKSQWKQFDTLINRLAKLSDNKRAELRKEGQL